MIRYLTLVEALDLHYQIIQQSEGIMGICDLGSLESAIAQPRMTFGGEVLYPTVVDKAAALGFSIIVLDSLIRTRLDTLAERSRSRICLNFYGNDYIMNHPFLDGNKRTGHAAMETFLVLNGLEINAFVDEQERVILALASGELERDAFTDWLQRSVGANVTLR